MAKRKSGSGGAGRGRNRPKGSTKRAARPRQRAKAGTRRGGGPATRRARASTSSSRRKRTAARPKPKAPTVPRTVPASSASATSRPRGRVGGEATTLDLDRSVLAIRSGRRELEEQLAEHTETGPVLTGGDIDANWEVAFSSGDEAPGGDNPTPDQDVVEELGRALGVEYQDNEELRGAAKLEERDRFRWEYNPASSEDYAERTRRRSDEH